MYINPMVQKICLFRATIFKVKTSSMWRFPLKFVYYDLTTSVLKNLRQLFDKYAVARKEHDALVKSTTKIFSNFVAFSENIKFNL